MKFCVYGICKNEINFIERFLNKVKAADYVALLDTGSTDGTFEYLNNHSYKTEGKLILDQINFTYRQFRFDTARNLSMELIPPDTDICIALDIDEYFDDGFIEILKNTVSLTDEIDCYLVERVEPKPPNPFVSRIHKFSQDRSIRWVDPVHETLSGINKYQYIDYLKMYHTPIQDLLLNEKKISMYNRLTEIRYKENPNDLFSIYYMFRTSLQEKPLNIEKVNHFKQLFLRALEFNKKEDIFYLQESFVQELFNLYDRVVTFYGTV